MKFSTWEAASEPWMKSSAGRGLPFSISPRSANVLARYGLPFFTSQNASLSVDSAIQNDLKMTSIKGHPVMILCVFSRLLTAIGTYSWY